MTNGSPGSPFSKTYATVSEISSPHIIQANNHHSNQLPIQQYQVQQQPLIKPPILPPKAGLGVANPSNTSRTAVLPTEENGNIVIVQKQQPPYVAPPFYENIHDVATSCK